MGQLGIREFASPCGYWFGHLEVLRKIFATSTHSLALRRFVVVLLKDAFTQVAPITDDLAGSSGISEGSDRASPNRMGGDRRGTLACMVVVSIFAGLWIIVVRARFSNLAWAGHPVDPIL